MLVGRVIERVETTKDSYFFLTKPDALKRRLTGRSVRELTRHGKVSARRARRRRSPALAPRHDRAVVLVRASAACACSRPRPAARCRPKRCASSKPDAHTHLSLHFEDGGPAVLFRDVRKFGKVALIRAGADDPRLDKLGVDALSASGQALVRGRARAQDPDQDAAARSRRDRRHRQHLRGRGAVLGQGATHAQRAPRHRARMPGRSCAPPSRS